MSVAEKAQRLRSLVKLLSDTSEVVIKEWEIAEQTASQTAGPLPPLPSLELFNARRIVLGACGMCMDLVQEPQSRLMELANQFHSSRALHVAAERRLADVLSDADPQVGMSIQEISRKVNIDQGKLARVLRCLCTIHVFTEVKKDHFANSPTSAQLVNNDPLRCWLVMHFYSSRILFDASNKLPTVLLDPIKTYSYSPRETAYTMAKGTSLTLWEHFEQGIKQQDGTTKPDPEAELFSLAMVGGGRMHEPPLYADYPWEALGSATFVDVGGGVGGMSIGLARKFPKLRFVVQDLASVISQAEAVWLRELPEAIKLERTRLMVHDVFKEQPIKGAEVYWMRFILHDWADDECVIILSNLREAMGTNSRILIADQVVHPTVGSSFLAPAPAPLPANYGWAHQFTNQGDLNMLTMYNGKERTPDDFSLLAERSGLRMVKIWECRGLCQITEMRRA
ncbi:hypothetical protein AcV7_004641 [Taiwanofungus camphoratus]|nr:hypothetical protein AcV7_004641 [Antrodia cinnamomea]